MKILHMADIHLGAAPDKGRPWGEGRDRQIWDAFAKALAAAEQKDVDLVLIAGDLFHRQPLKRELKEVNYLFSKLSRAKVVIMAGNHDYLAKNSAYRTFLWNKNIYFLQKEKIEFIEFSHLNAIIYGLSYEHREIKDSLYREIRKQSTQANGGSLGIHILLAHGGDENHIPLQIQELERMGFDYIALGHIHKPEQLKENRIVMAGALQPLDYNDPGPHGYWITEFIKGDVSAAFYPVRGCEYVHVVIGLERSTTNRELVDMVRDRITESEPYQIFKIILTGQHDPDMEPDAGQLEGLDRVAAVEVRCKPAYDFEKLKDEYEQQVIGRFIREIESMQQNPAVRKALYYGVDALMGSH